MNWLLVVALALSALAAWAVVHEPRRATNAVLCGLAGLALFPALASTPGSPMGLALLAVVFLSPVFAVVLVLALLVNGVLVVRREGRSLGNLLSGLTGIALVLAALSSFGMIATNAAPIAALGVFILLATGWLGFLFTCMVVYQWGYAQWAAGRRPDYVVALGAGLIRGRVGKVLANRVRRAVEIAQRTPGPRRPVLFMSGGQGADEPRSEASAMAEYAHQELAVPDAAIVEEGRSTTTEENLRFTTALVEADPRLGKDARGLAVTSNFHVLRAAELARRQGLDVQVTGAPVAWYFWPSAILREFVAQLVYHKWLVAIVTALVTLPLPIVVALP